MRERYEVDPELKLLLACARWPRREADQRDITELAANLTGWEGFVELAKHHRIVPLVSHSLSAALGCAGERAARDAVAELRRLAALSAMESLRLLAELRRVMVAFAAAGVHVRILKGLPLAKLVLGDISMRSPGDIDLLVEEEKFLESDRVLRELGYTGLFAPERFSPRQLAYYRDHWKDLAYENHRLGVSVDLHWRCFRNPAMSGGKLCGAKPPQMVTFGGLAVETSPRPEALLYLCVHGTLDGWVYLKSLVDVAAQVRSLSEPELDALAEVAQHHDVLPELTATLLLVHRFFGMDSWSKRLLPQSEPTVRHILGYAAQTLDRRRFRASREDIPIADTLRFEWALRKGFRYRRELMLRVLYRARMWETIRLPDWLFWAYPLLSPVEWVLFRMRRGESGMSKD